MGDPKQTSQWLKPTNWAVVLASLVGVSIGILSLVSIIGRLAQTPTLLLEGPVESYRLGVAALDHLVARVLSFIPYVELRQLFTPQYVEALLPSIVVTLGYVRATDRLAASGVLAPNKYRPILRPVVAVVLSLSLIGLALIVSLIADSLKGEAETRIAAHTFAQTGFAFFVLFGAPPLLSLLY